MSVQGYSVSQDGEVQEYNLRRAAYKASEKTRKQEQKRLREQANATREAALKQAGLGRRMGWSLTAPTSWRRHAAKATVPVKFEGGYESDENTLSEALEWK